MMNPFRVLLEKPWNARPLVEGAPPELDFVQEVAPQKVALMFFLVVVAILFALFFSAYFIRMELDDWRPIPLPNLLWVNTGILFLSSLALQWTYNVLKKGDLKNLKTGLATGALLTLAFICGQLLVWQQLSEAGLLISSNPSNSFFYVLTGIHVLHILGGLWVWTRASIKVWSGKGLDEVRLSIELCALYWHFLLLVWLVVFALFSYT